MKKVLVISNNPFSQSDNNGKTLASLFKDLNGYEIAQLYFSSTKPTELLSANFFSITDYDMLLASLRRLGIKKVGPKNIMIDKKMNNNSPGNFKRLFRELLWSKKNWFNSNFKNWLEKFTPDLVFFLAGDCEFAFNITDFICTTYNSKLIVYITDDYYVKYGLPITLENFRKLRLRKKLKKLLRKTNLLVTISEQMQKKYKEIFNFESINFFNCPINKPTFKDKNGNILYAGSLSLGRLNTLIELGNALKKYNLSNNKNINLHIFSSTLIGNKKLNILRKTSTIFFHNQISMEELYVLYNNYSYLVHVESFKKRFVNKTLYSISTKIPEYLNSSAKIIAIGPSKLASISLIEDYVFVINNNRKITESLTNILNNKEYFKSDRSILISKIHDDKQNLINNIIELLNN